MESEQTFETELTPLGVVLLQSLDDRSGEYAWTRVGILGGSLMLNGRELTSLVHQELVERRRDKKLGSYEFRITSQGRKRLRAWQKIKS